MSAAEPNSDHNNQQQQSTTVESGPSQPSQQTSEPAMKQETAQTANAVSQKHPSSNDHIDMKLFVGRLPISSTEVSLQSLFSEFGPVVEVIIIRDKQTEAHKGSAFVRMASITDADAAIRAFHNIKVVDPVLGPLHVSYATGEAERLGFHPESINPSSDEAKLFVNSLPRDVTEQDVEKFFSSYGTVRDAHLMRYPVTGRFKGCGFITFTRKEQALLAIRQIHTHVTFSGANRPLELRVADPPRRLSYSGPGTRLSPHEEHRYSQQQIQPQPQLLNANPRQAGLWKEYIAPDGCPYYHNDQLGLTQWEIPPEFLSLQQQHPPRASLAAGDITGPLGANVFVFHVPNEWRREDLAAYFAPFGYILSAKVATDRSTGRNKGYGFVSYDNVRSALEAVQQMNLVPVENKRLRVAIKTGEEEHARHYAEQHGIIYQPEHASALQPVPYRHASLGATGSMEGNPSHQQYRTSQRYSPRQQPTGRYPPSAAPHLYSGNRLPGVTPQFMSHPSGPGPAGSGSAGPGRSRQSASELMPGRQSVDHRHVAAMRDMHPPVPTQFHSRPFVGRGRGNPSLPR